MIIGDGVWKAMGIEFKSVNSLGNAGLLASAQQGWRLDKTHWKSLLFPCLLLWPLASSWSVHKRYNTQNPRILSKPHSLHRMTALCQHRRPADQSAGFDPGSLWGLVPSWLKRTWSFSATVVMNHSYICLVYQPFGEGLFVPNSTDLICFPQHSDILSTKAPWVQQVEPHFPSPVLGDPT